MPIDLDVINRLNDVLSVVREVGKITPGVYLENCAYPLGEKSLQRDFKRLRKLGYVTITPVALANGGRSSMIEPTTKEGLLKQQDWVILRMVV